MRPPSKSALFEAAKSWNVDIARARRLPNDVIARLEDLKRSKQAGTVSLPKSV